MAIKISGSTIIDDSRNVVSAGIVTATSFSGSGADLTALNASNLASGTVPDARFPATLPAASGANLTALNASNLASGTVPDARFPATLPAASGASLTALNASNLASGTIPDARFPATLPAASGVNLTALNGSNISSGTIAAARVATLNQDTTGTADNFTVTANNSTNETVYPVFVDGATGSQGGETDTGLNYNPSTGALTAASFLGSGANLTNLPGFEPDADENLVAGTGAGDNLDGTSACFNVLLGNCVGKNITSGNRNVYIGERAGCGKTASTGSRNTFLGYYAGACITSGNENVVLGYLAACKLCTGSGNVVLGTAASRYLTSGCYNVFLGEYAGHCVNTGCYNVFLGCGAGKAVTSGASNIFLGNKTACGGTVTGNDNISVGQLSGCCLTSGACNIFLGFGAGKKITTAGDNIMMGRQVAANSQATACSNIVIGLEAGYNMGAACNNVMIGTQAGCDVTGRCNVFLGYQAGTNVTSGCDNIFLGTYAGNTNTSGSCNIAIGRDVELPSATGNGQLAIGDGSNRWLTGDSSFNVTVSTASTFSSGGLNVTGVVTATSFAGDGSALTGIAAGGGSGEFNTGITSTVQATPLSFESTMHTFPSTSGRQYVIESINVANVDESVGVGTTVNIIASIQDATAGERTYIAYNVPIVTGGTIELLKNPIVAGPSDVIKMWTTNDGYVGVNDAVDVYINYAEHESTDFISKFAATTTINSTDTITLYTSTSNPTMIEKIGFANRTDTGDFPVSIKVTSGTTTSYLAKNLIIPRYSTVDILDRPKRIETNAKIEVEVGSTGTIDVIIAGKKITS